ncbi:MAG: S4 domain-containing protein [Candidatus Parvarchaeota archaeon]|nr:S4 domain-containing protein [Candidatus Parvarchaeota archaeon]
MAKHGESKHASRSSITNRIVIPRKRYKYYFRPIPSSHKKHYSIALPGLLRDVMKIASNAREAVFLMKQGYVKVDGKIVKDKKREVGFGDLISVKGEDFKVWLNDRGGLTVVSDEESKGKKKLKVISKHLDKGGILILSLSDGSNVKAGANDVNINDTVIIDLAKREVEKVIPMEQGRDVIVFMGKNAGKTGKIREISGDDVEFDADGEKVRAKIESCMVL